MPHNTYFQGNPTRLDVSRSIMPDARPRWTGGWNVGRLIPIFATSLVMPGDNFKMSVSSAIRMIRPVVPVMDDMEITIEAYFVPHRLVLSRKSMSPDVNDSNHSWSAFIGAQDSLLNMPTPGDVKLATLKVSTVDYVVGGVGDCLGFHIPQGSLGVYHPNCLKALAFYSVWNEYFREPNTQSPVVYSIGPDLTSPTTFGVTLYGQDAGFTGLGETFISKVACPPVSRYHGYFGSALPWPQRNSSTVTMPLGSTAPIDVKTSPNNIQFSFVNSGTSDIAASSNVVTPGSNWSPGVNVPLISDGQYVRPAISDSALGVLAGNLFTDLSQATAASVNQFRLAVQTQRWYEALARSGNKYSDLVHGMFGVRGVSIPDRPEYLGGFTAPINISQVAGTNGASGGNLGDVGAFSLSNPGGFLFSKGFTEHGTIIVVACTRVRESFAQGFNREDFKYERFDYYWPQFANLGEQAILKKELYVDGSSGNTTDEAVFGYQEAWAEYRMFNDQVTGYLNPTNNLAIGAYTYANVFASAPTLKGYLNASGQADIVDRTLSVAHDTAGFQLFGQFEFQIQMVRPMPTYSIPGLVDHH